jgi:hypothetical protein
MTVRKHVSNMYIRMELQEHDSSFVCYLVVRYFLVGVLLYQPPARRLEVGILDEL